MQCVSWYNKVTYAVAFSAVAEALFMHGQSSFEDGVFVISSHFCAN